MPENPRNGKVPQSASPVARFGAGDISERELSQERHNLRTTTPPTRVQPAHPKKQLFSTPVSKFTAKVSGPSPNLQRIQSCLEDYRSQATPARPVKIGPKAVSMEDLTPNKRVKRERQDIHLPVVMSPGPQTAVEVQAAVKIAKFLMMSAWRRRREEVRCLRKTLEFQVSCSERLRIQVSTLKSLLDSDNAKVRLAMRELERLKQLVREKEMEKAVLEREKVALEKDVCAAEDQASEMSIGWRNCRNELEDVRTAASLCELALANERAAVAEARSQRDHAYKRLASLEDELAQHEALLSAAEEEVATLRREADERQRVLQITSEELAVEQEARNRCTRECALLSARVSRAADEGGALRGQLGLLRAEQARLAAELALTREQLNWWPRPLTKLMGLIRSLFRSPLSLPETIMWAMLPARHGC
ncbi:myosin-2 [Amyelois transitella]|uniref:myosin-2 n=1 Tax=Amyelois transitella TaxID=680683 RepID=UPI0029903499|nr:myosin-2 [Amyelois transitella]